MAVGCVLARAVKASGDVNVVGRVHVEVAEEISGMLVEEAFLSTVAVADGDGVGYRPVEAWM
jgi:hypothetical protein